MKIPCIGGPNHGQEVNDFGPIMRIRMRPAYDVQARQFEYHKELFAEDTHPNQRHERCYYVFSGTSMEDALAYIMTGELP